MTGRPGQETPGRTRIGKVLEIQVTVKTHALARCVDDVPVPLFLSNS